MKGGSFAGFDDADAHVQATLHGRRAEGHVTASVGEVGTIDVQSSSIQVGEAGALSLSSWRRAWGAVDVKAHVDLPGLVSRLPPDTVPLAKVLGVVDLSARIQRDSENDSSPAVDLTLATTGLVLASGGKAPWRVEGVDPSFHATVDGDTGATGVELQLHDVHGPIARLDATSKSVPYDRVASGEGLADALLAMPVDARLELFERELPSLPAALGTGDLRGTIEGVLEWHGSARQPQAHLTTSLSRGKDDPTAATLPVDLSLTADYDGRRATAKLDAMSRNKLVIGTEAVVNVRAQDFVAAAGGAALPWTGSAHAKFAEMPLRTLSWLNDRQVRGRVNGEVSLDGLHEDARAVADLTFDGLAVGEVVCKSASFKAKLDGHTLDADVRIAQEDGRAEAQVHVGTHWGSALVPALDVAQQASAKLAAEKFRAVLLLPFVSNVFSELDGRIDANAGFTADPSTGAAHPEGSLELSEGSFELSSIGGEFADVSGKVRLTPDGLVRLQDFVAHGLTGKLEASATARLAGMRFVGATGTLHIARKDAVPLAYDGVQVGTLDGRIDLGMEPAQGGGLDVRVDAPSLHLELPTTGQHDVQSLGGLEGVVTGAYVAGQDFVEIPLDGTVRTDAAVARRAPITLRIRLGDDVEVSRGDEVSVWLTGQPVVRIADELTITGQIRLVRGNIDVRGRPFVIEKGIITFGGKDPMNPQVVLTASWQAGDTNRTRVYADFTGPLKTGKVTLRSNPPLSDNDILSLILTEQTLAEASASSTQQGAGSVAGTAASVATAPIDQALGGLNRTLDKFGAGISAKIGSSESNPMPEVQLQIARDISIRVGYIIGTPTFGNLDTTLVTLSWAFARQWNLETTAGNTGTTVLDLFWQHRY